jgi:FtsZ-binding cell division protein ZapB
MLTNISVTGLLSRSEVSPSPEPQTWSSAVGHASTGKSGRVIERLQVDIDRLHREKQLLKVRFEESEKTNEALQTRNQYLQDRNSNYEQSHEANLRQLARKERQVEEFREELKREKHKTAIAQQIAQAATRSEEEWRDQASQARSIAAQKESEYEAIVSCRKLDHDRHQGALDRMKENFEALLRDRQDDLDRSRKLEIIAEQQKQTISQLEELTKRLTANFKAYRMEIDKAIADIRRHASSNDSAISTKLDEMTDVTGQMRWVMNMDKEVQKGQGYAKSESPRKGLR